MSLNSRGYDISGSLTRQSMATDPKEEKLTAEKQLTKLDTEIKREGMKVGVFPAASRQALQKAAEFSKNGDNVGALKQLRIVGENLVKAFGIVPEKIQAAINTLKKELGEVEVSTEIGKMTTGLSIEKNPKPKHGLRKSGFPPKARVMINASGKRINNTMQRPSIVGTRERGGGKLEGGMHSGMLDKTDNMDRFSVKATPEVSGRERAMVIASKIGVTPKQPRAQKASEKAPSKDAASEISATTEQALGQVKKAKVLGDNSSMIATQQIEIETVGREAASKATHYFHTAAYSIEKGSYKEAIGQLKAAEAHLYYAKLATKPGYARETIISLNQEATELRGQIEKMTVRQAEVKAPEESVRREGPVSAEPIPSAKIKLPDDPIYKKYTDLNSRAAKIGSEAQTIRTQSKLGQDDPKYIELDKQQKILNDNASEVFKTISPETKKVFKLFKFTEEVVNGEVEYNKDINGLLKRLEKDSGLNKEFKEEIDLLEKLVASNNEILKDLNTVVSRSEIDAEGFSKLINSKKFDNYMKHMANYSSKFDAMLTKLESMTERKTITDTIRADLVKEAIKPVQRGMRYKDLLVGLAGNSPDEQSKSFFNKAANAAIQYADRSNEIKRTLEELSVLDELGGKRRIHVKDGKLSLIKKGLRKKHKTSITELGVKRVISLLKQAQEGGISVQKQINALQKDKYFQALLKKDREINGAFKVLKT